jgi:hypothetical protein
LQRYVRMMLKGQEQVCCILWDHSGGAVVG